MGYDKVKLQIYGLIDSGLFSDAKQLIEDNGKNLSESAQRYLEAYITISEGKFSKCFNSLETLIPDLKKDELLYYDTHLLLARAEWWQDKISSAISRLNTIYFQLKEADIDIEEIKRYTAHILYLKSAILLNLGRAIFRSGTELNTDDISIPLEYATESLQLYQDLGDEMGISNSKSALAFVYWITDKFNRPKSLLEDALKYYKDNGKKLLEANCLELLGTLYQITFRDFKIALDYFSQALKLRELIGDKYGQARSFENHGDYYYDMWDLHKFEKFFEKSLTIYSELGDDIALSWINYKIGLAYQGIGQFNEAKSKLNNALVMFDRLKNEKGKAITLTRLGSNALTLGGLGSNALTLGDMDLGKQYQNQSLEICKKIGYLTSAELYAKHNLVFIFRLEGDLDKSRKLLEDVIEGQPKIGYNYNVAQALHDLGEVCRLQGRYQEALQFYDEALDATIDFEKVPIIFFQDVITCYHYIVIATQKFRDINLLPYIDILKSTKLNIVWLDPIQRAAEAIYLKSSSRLKDHYKAQSILEEVIKSQTLITAITGLTPEFTLLEILLDEFKSSGEVVVLEEIKNLLDVIHRLANELQNDQLIVDLNIIQSKLAQVQGNFDESNSILQGALKLAETIKSDAKTELINSELNQLEETFKTYNQWIEQNLSMKERTSKLEISEYIKMVQTEILEQ